MNKVKFLFLGLGYRVLSFVELPQKIEINGKPFDQKRISIGSLRATIFTPSEWSEEKIWEEISSSCSK